jgi:hypothetical protein
MTNDRPATAPGFTAEDDLLAAALGDLREPEASNDLEQRVLAKIRRRRRLARGSILAAGALGVGYMIVVTLQTLSGIGPRPLFDGPPTVTLAEQLDDAALKNLLGEMALFAAPPTADLPVLFRQQQALWAELENLSGGDKPR